MTPNSVSEEEEEEERAASTFGKSVYEFGCFPSQLLLSNQY